MIQSSKTSLSCLGTLWVPANDVHLGCTGRQGQASPRCRTAAVKAKRVWRDPMRKLELRSNGDAWLFRPVRLAPRSLINVPDSTWKAFGPTHLCKKLPCSFSHVPGTSHYIATSGGSCNPCLDGISSGTTRMGHSLGTIDSRHMTTPARRSC